MAKNNRKTTIALIGLTATVIVIIAAIVKGYVSLESEVEYQKKTHIAAVETIKNEGCLPARESKTEIQLIQKDIVTIKDSQKDMEETQKAMDGKLDELLRRTREQ